MLFGHQNDDTNQPVQAASADPVVGVNPLAVDPATGASLPVAPAEPPMPPDSTEPSILNQPVASLDEPATSLPAPEIMTTAADTAAPTGAPAVQPTDDSSPFSATNQDFTDTTAPTPTDETVLPDTTPEAHSDLRRVGSNPTNSAPSDLLSLKQQALTQLEPLVNQLDQTPEEKFRTTMMLIQSTDNQSLIQDAYDTAQSITDEKVRAQALLDVINEINYFTQQQTKD